MRGQRNDASAGVMWIAKEVAVWIYRISRGVKPVCRLNRIKNLIPISGNYTFN